MRRARISRPEPRDRRADAVSARARDDDRPALVACRQAFAALRDRRGAVVLVTPTAGVVGEAGYVPTTAAGEGIRALAKGAARQWGERGITVNCVAPPLALFGARTAPPVEARSPGPRSRASATCSSRRAIPRSSSAPR